VRRAEIATLGGIAIVMETGRKTKKDILSKESSWLHANLFNIDQSLYTQRFNADIYSAKTIPVIPLNWMG
jgi:hypothetical protein